MISAPARVAVALLAFLLAACAAPAARGTASGACAGPVLTTAETTAAAGQELMLRVEGLKDGCADAIGMNEKGEVTFKETEVPLTEVPIVFEQGGVQEQVGTVSAGDDFTAAVTVTIPADALPGEVILRLDHPDAARLTLHIIG